jgi:hypothetical protein
MLRQHIFQKFLFGLVAGAFSAALLPHRRRISGAGCIEGSGKMLAAVPGSSPIS